jgi:UDP-N-acetylglucosamine 2-epimerase (non-hydrolysing)
MKVAPLMAAIQEHNLRVEWGSDGPVINHVLVHTGQHYDAAMSGSFFTDLHMPEPDIMLGAGSGSNVAQTADILAKFETVLLQERPDVVVVVGDVNSTAACALATAKIAFDSTGRRPLLAHVESGLRSFDRLMPEEVNRVITDHMADVLLVTEESGMHNLQAEGISPDAIHFVGNTMIDSLLKFKQASESSKVLDKLGLRCGTTGNGNPAVARYALLTLHRPSNVDDQDTFLNILAGLEQLAAEFPVIFPAHPRTRRRITEFGLERYFRALELNGSSGAAGIHIMEPVGYLDCLSLMNHAMVVITDSGGIQEETTCLGVPCVTVRENTERPVTMECGTNVLAGTATEKIAEAIRRQLAGRDIKNMPRHWDGQAAGRIVEVLTRAYTGRMGAPASAVA